MQIESHVDALREDLAHVAAVGDETTARAAELLAVALNSSFGRRFQEALAEAALELSARMEHGTVEVRIAGGEPELAYIPEAEPSRAEMADEALTARITLRVPESLKSRLEGAAAADAVSVNTWLVQTLTRILEPRPAPGANRYRLTGYGQT